MKKFIILGHPGSDYLSAKEWLQTYGMVDALPSRLQRLPAEQISQTLCQAAGCRPLQDTDDDGRLRQLRPDRIWSELTLDLMMGNIDQPIWGWADPAGVHLLDHWCEADSDIRFVFVYDAPETAFRNRNLAVVSPRGRVTVVEPALEETSASSLAFDERVNEWCAYNTTLLHFFLRHRERCVLLHAPSLRALMADSAEAGTSLAKLLGLEVGEPVAATSHAVCDEKPLMKIVCMLARQLAKGHPSLAALHAQLDAVADLPTTTPASSPQMEQDRLYQAWRALSALHVIDLRHNQLREENQLLMQQLFAAQEQFEAYFLKCRQLQSELQGKALAKRSGIKKSLTQEDSQAKIVPATKKVWRLAIERAKAYRHAKLLDGSNLFDAEWYLDRYPDVANVKAFYKHPAMHYLMHGAGEGRDPSAAFSTERYLDNYPDVAESGINPLIHYICHGQRERRRL